LLRNEFLPALNEVWRAIDLVFISKDDEQRDRRRATAYQALGYLPLQELLKTIDDLLSTIGPKLRVKLVPVRTGIQLLYDDFNRGPNEKGGGFLSHLAGLRFTMTRLVTLLGRYDQTMAEMFEGRTKLSAEITPTVESIRSLIESSEQGELWS
jgi:hypothetical protein